MTLHLANDRSRLIVVALRTLDSAGPLVSFAETIALSSGAALTLVHVIDPMVAAVQQVQIGVPYGPWPSMPRGFEENDDADGSGMSAAQRHDLEASAILEELDPKIHAQYLRLEGDIEETVMDYAVDHSAALVLIGTRAQKVRFLPALFYQTMQFMADTRVPLLVVPNDYEFKPRTPLRILITDDMSENLGPVRMGVDLTKLLGFCYLLHIHVRDYADFSMGLGGLSNIGMIADGYLPYSDYDPTAQLTAEHEKIERALERRFKEVCAERKIDTESFSYEAQFLIGEVSEEISRSAATFQADLVVFGGHGSGGLQLFHHKTMPDRIKLRQHRPILIAPVRKAG